MDHLALGNACLDAGAHGSLEDAPKPISSPPLPNARQRGMIRKPVAQTKACKPADGQIHLRFTHQASVVNNPKQEACQHQAQGSLGVYRGPTDSWGVNLSHLIMQP